MVACLCPLCASYFCINYVEMQDKYVHMQDSYVNIIFNKGLNIYFFNARDKSVSYHKMPDTKGFVPMFCTLR